MVDLLFHEGSCPSSGVGSLSFRRTSPVAGHRPCVITVLVLEIVAETGHRVGGVEGVQWREEQQDRPPSLENRKQVLMSEAPKLATQSNWAWRVRTFCACILQDYSSNPVILH